MSFSPPRFFRPPHTASATGLVGYDRRLSVERMQDAYAHGIFPWPHREQDGWEIGWYSPDPRAILPLDGLHVPRRLTRKLRTGRFRFTWNCRFPEILRECATAGSRRWEGTWLYPPLREVLEALFQRQQAFSVEVYDDSISGMLCGGIYGVATGTAFSAESMFHHVSDASKAAVVFLVGMLQKLRYRLLDIQVASPHMCEMGAVTLPRSDYLEQLAIAIQTAAADWPACDRPYTYQEIIGPLPISDRPS